MTTASLEQALPEGERILLDTTALAAYLDASESTHDLARHVVDGLVAPGRNPAIVSMITVMELLVRPLRATPHGHHTILAFIRAGSTSFAAATEADPTGFPRTAAEGRGRRMVSWVAWRRRPSI